MLEPFEDAEVGFQQPPVEFIAGHFTLAGLGAAEGRQQHFVGPGLPLPELFPGGVAIDRRLLRPVPLSPLRLGGHPIHGDVA